MTQQPDEPSADPARPGRSWRKLIDLDGDFVPDVERIYEPCNCSHLGPCPDGDPFADTCPRRQHPAFRSGDSK